MAPVSRSLRLGLLLGAFAFLLTSTTQAAVITGPGGAYQVGITNSGALFQSGAFVDNLGNPRQGVGFARVADGYDPIEPFLSREYWGVRAGAVSGYVDPQGTIVPNTQNIVANGAPSFTPSTASISSFLNGGSGNVVRIDQLYSFVAANVLQIGVTITNLTNSAQAISYRRGVDWDIEPYPAGAPAEIVNIPQPSGKVAAATNQGTGPSPSPNTPYGAFGTPGGVFGPLDLGSGFTLDLGILDPANQPNGRISTTFRLFHAINFPGQSEAELRAQVAELGGAYITSGRSTASGAVNSAVLAVDGEVPEPATLALLAMGLAGMGAHRLRRRAK